MSWLTKRADRALWKKYDELNDDNRLLLLRIDGLKKLIFEERQLRNRSIDQECNRLVEFYLKLKKSEELHE